MKVAALHQRQPKTYLPVVRDSRSELNTDAACVTMYICWRKRTGMQLPAVELIARQESRFEPLTTPRAFRFHHLMSYTCAARGDDGAVSTASPTVRQEGRNRRPNGYVYLAVLKNWYAGPHRHHADDESLTVHRTPGVKCNSFPTLPGYEERSGKRSMDLKQIGRSREPY